MHDHLSRTLERLERVQRDRIEPRVHERVSPVTVTSWLVEDGEPVSPAHAIGLAVDPDRAAPRYRSFELGSPWGEAWATRWFRIEGTVPAGCDDAELLVDLGWFDHSVGGHCEALVFDADARPVKGLHPKQRWVALRGAHARPGLVAADGSFTLWIEAAANPLLLGLPPFVVTEHGERGASGFDQFRLRTAEIARVRREVYELARDLEVVGGLAGVLHEDDPRRWRLLRGVEEALDAYDERDAEASAAVARQVLEPLLASPAAASALRITAVGHAHMDSAWLWPLQETVRKLGRTVSNALALLDADDSLVYTMTSAQHFLWLEEHYPDLFARVRAYVECGRFIPVGGMWVEVDGVIPAGESLVRQMLLGKRYFADRFGIENREIWLPDSFGYSAALPQLAARSGSDVFLTQKISWNDTTVFPHHSFWWEGLDGTRVFTHFPPADTYAASVTADELAHSVSNFKEKAIATRQLLAYGYGDGGGGPTREMASRLQRFHDIEGAPRLESAAPQDFFRAAEAELRALPTGSALAPVWSGELYLELHRGSLTSQQAMKRGNRISESLLRAVEHAWAVVALLTGEAPPAERITALWRTVLLHQFHDILPGTSIAWVHREARDAYADAERALRQLLDEANELIASAGAAVDPLPTSAPEVRVEPSPDGGTLLDNGKLRVLIDGDGHVRSLRRGEGPEAVAEGGRLGEFLLFKDEPVRWDAWDLDRHVLRHPRPIRGADEVTVVRDDRDAGVRSVRRSGASTIESTVWLRVGAAGLEVRTQVDWQEREQLLKVAFPLAQRARFARFETQYGSVERPLHSNTAADEAMFEASMQRFVHVAEADAGTAVIAGTIAGADARTDANGTGTTVRLSLLRGARFPDPNADLGVHRFTWLVLPDVGIPETVEAAQQLVQARGGERVPELVALEPTAGHAVVDWVKLAEDGSGDVIARLYETQGARATARLRVHPLLREAQVAENDLLERPAPLDGPRLALDREGTARDVSDVVLELHPYQVCTLRFTLHDRPHHYHEVPRGTP